ncbi:MAG: S9 family peptidase [Acidobacteriaceae bacterium]|nr:S9 family peptidase [Acidobacteriaceae bacterium]
MSKFTAIFVACVLAFAVRAHADEQTRADRVLQQLEQVHRFTGISISPDGRWVAWTGPDPDTESNTRIFLYDRQDGSKKVRRLTAGNGKQSFREHGLAWSPDSTRIALFSNANGTQEQIFVLPVSGGAARKLTNVNGYLTDIRWAADGKRLAFLYAEGGGGAGPLEAEPAQIGIIGSSIHNQRITTIDADGGNLRQITPPDLNVYEYDWSPDGQQFAATAAPGPADNNWWTAKLYTVDGATGKMTAIYEPPVQRQLAVPRWSPDGKQIAFIGGLMSDEGFNGGDIFLIQGEGGEPRDLTAGIHGSASGLVWQEDGKLLFTETVDGGGAIATLSLGDNTTEVLWKGTEAVHQDGNFPNFSLARDARTSAWIRSSWQQPPEVFAGAIGDWQQLTHKNANQQPRWGKAESIEWSNDGFRIQGWLLYPEDYNPQRRYPMIVDIHGGPSNLTAQSWPSPGDTSTLAALGYFVFFPNPRGSYGAGEAFTEGNVKDFGGGDLRDILAGIDTALKKVPVDENRLGVTGWSYGGYMTMWTVTQTNRFRAAVAGAGIADWLSYYGENMIDQWMLPFFGASVYNDPAVYAKSSPITYIKNVKTPTLVLVGERDGECPAPQSFEFWHALRTLHVPTELVVYPGEGHAFHLAKDRADRFRRTVIWFDHFLSVQN